MAGSAAPSCRWSYTPMWVEQMTAGRGWIALALVVFASWRPWRLLLGAYLFGGVTILQLYAAGRGHVRRARRRSCRCCPISPPSSCWRVISARPLEGPAERAGLPRQAVPAGRLSRRNQQPGRPRTCISINLAARRSVPCWAARPPRRHARRPALGRAAGARSRPAWSTSARSAISARATSTTSAARRSQRHLATRSRPPSSRTSAEGPDAERVIRQLATTGNSIIFTTSFGFMNSTVQVAKQFPKVKFEHATGYQTAPNRRRLQRPLLRGPGGDRHDRRHDDQVGHRRLHRLVPDPRGGDGHQRLHAGGRRSTGPTSRSRWSGSTAGTIRARRRTPPRR